MNFQTLSGQRKKAYNEAKDFIERAEVAIKASNFELAKDLAGKAEKLANELQGRLGPQFQDSHPSKSPGHFAPSTHGAQLENRAVRKTARPYWISSTY